MKRLILGMTIGALSLGSVMADRPAVEKRGQEDNTEYQYVYVTGSNIPQRVKKRQFIAVGASSPTLIIDQREMQRSGNSNIGQILSHYPGVGISGH